MKYSVNDISIKKLEKLGIYELRNLARSLGVPRPTSLLRGQLMNEVLERVFNNAKTDIEPPSRGRKPKITTWDIRKIVDDSALNEDGSIIREDDCFMVTTSHCVRNTDGITVRSIDGFYHCSSGSHGLLICAEMLLCYIPALIVVSNNLRMGDQVQADVTYDSEKQAYFVVKVTSVNGIDATKYNTDSCQSFEERKAVRADSLFNLQGKQVKLGNSILVTTPNPFDSVQFIKDCAGDLTGKKVHKIALVIEDTDYCKEFLTESGIDQVFATYVGNDYQKQSLMALVALFTAQHRAMSGENVILFVCNFNKLYKLYQKSAAVERRIIPGTVDVSLLEDVKTFYTSAKALADGGSLTIVGLMPNSSDQVSQYILSELLDVSNVEISLM